MHEHDSPAHAASPEADARRAQLLAAAEAVRTWARDQRASWSSPPAGAVAASLPPFLAPEPATPSAPAAGLPVAAPADPGFAQPESEMGRERRRKEWQVGETIASVTRSLSAGARAVGGPLVRWSMRLGLAAILLAVLGGAGWKAREYWLSRPASPDEPAPAPQPVVVPLKGRATGGPVRTGRLRVESEPSGAKVFVDGRNRGVTPLTVDSLPVGTHVVVLDSSKGTVQRTVGIAFGETAQISETIYSGWVAIASPIELSVSEGGQTLRSDERDRFILSPGSHELQLENRALGYRETRKVDVRPGEVTRLSLSPPESTLSVTATLPAVVTVDGERAGETPLSGHPIKLGTRDISVKAASGAEKHLTITVTSMPVKLDVDFSRP